MWDFQVLPHLSWSHCNNIEGMRRVACKAQRETQTTWLQTMYNLRGSVDQGSGKMKSRNPKDKENLKSTL